MTLWLIVAPSDPAHAEDQVIQISPDENPIVEEIVVVEITTESIESQIDAAQTSLEESMQTEAENIINEIILNTGVTEEEATEIAITQDPIAPAVEEANAEIQQAQGYIESATAALDLAKDAKIVVQEQESIVLEAQSNVDSSTVLVTEAEIILQEAVAVLPVLQEAESSTATTFYEENMNLAIAGTGVQVAQNDVLDVEAQIRLEGSGELTTTYIQKDDDGSFLMNLPYELKMGDQTYSQVYVGTNGLITFGAPQGWGGNAPAVYVMFQDWWNVDQETYLRYTTTINSLLVEWNVVPYGTNANNTSTSQLTFDADVNPLDGSWIADIYYTSQNREAQTNSFQILENTNGQGQIIDWQEGSTSTNLSAHIDVTDYTPYTPPPKDSNLAEALDVAQSNLSIAQSNYTTALELRDAAYTAWTNAVNDLSVQQSVIDSAMQNLTIANQTLQDAINVLSLEQANLTPLQENLTVLTSVAKELTVTSEIQVQEAITAMTNAVQVTINYYAEQERIAAENARIIAEQEAAKAAQEAAAAEARALIAAEIKAQAAAQKAANDAAIAEQKVAQEKAVADAKAAEESKIAAEQAAKEAQAETDKAEANAKIQAEKDAQAKLDSEKADADKMKAEADKSKAEQEAKVEAQKAADQKAKDEQASRNKAANDAKIASEQKAKEAEVAKAKAENDAKVAQEKTLKNENLNKEDSKKILDNLNADGKVTQAEAKAVIESIKQEGKTLNVQQKSLVSAVLVQAANSSGKTLTSAQIQSSGIKVQDLPPQTPVDVRTDEKGNEVVITAEVAAQVELLNDPGALLEEALSDPGAALQALGSIGADMSDEERAEATDMVVATVVATGAAINAVAAATGGSAPSSGGGSSGGGSGANSPGSRGGRKW